MYESWVPMIHRDGLTSSELLLVQELDSLANSSSVQFLQKIAGSIVNTAVATTAYAVLTGGITGTGALQQVSGIGTSGQVLTSNGSGALPTWQAASSSGHTIEDEGVTLTARTILNFVRAGVAVTESEEKPLLQ